MRRYLDRYEFLVLWYAEHHLDSNCLGTRHQDVLTVAIDIGCAASKGVDQ